MWRIHEQHYILCVWHKIHMHINLPKNGENLRQLFFIVSQTIFDMCVFIWTYGCNIRHSNISKIHLCPSSRMMLSKSTSTMTTMVCVLPENCRIMRISSHRFVIVLRLIWNTIAILFQSMHFWSPESAIHWQMIATRIRHEQVRMTGGMRLNKCVSAASVTALVINQHSNNRMLFTADPAVAEIIPKPG